MFKDVVTMNELFGNPKGDLAAVDFERLKSQMANVGDELAEFQDALAARDIEGMRDALCDIMVFTLGGCHLMGADADADMRAVFNSQMSKFCANDEELEATKEKYRRLGVSFYEEGEFPCKYLKCDTDITVGKDEYRKGKFLKGINYAPPVFA